MKFTPLSPADSAALDSDREFVRAALGAHFGGELLSGTQRDIALLQRVLESRPYTDKPDGEVIALGTTLGDLLSRALGMPWVHIADEHGDDLGLRYGDTSIVIFPRNMLLRRVEDGEEPEMQHLYDGVISEIQELVTSGEFQ